MIKIMINLGRLINPTICDSGQGRCRARWVVCPTSGVIKIPWDSNMELCAGIASDSIEWAQLSNQNCWNDRPVVFSLL